MLRSIKQCIGGFKFSGKKDPDKFLEDISGLIHIGANTGQERDQYEKLGLQVIWIEPIPEVFATLEQNIAPLSRQRAIRALITDQDAKEYEFNVSSNNGESSSILDFKLHKSVWPSVTCEKKIKLLSKSLPALVAEEKIDLDLFNALVLDTQGSELLVLQGAIPLLHHFRYIKSEVPDFESYQGCCQLKDIANFMACHGYEEISKHRVAKGPGGARYYDVVYRKI